MPTHRRATRARNWIYLAGAYLEVLADDGAARRSFEQAVAIASAPDELADLAGGYIEIFDDHTAARDVLDRAERRARSSGELRDMWRIANGWLHGVGDSARARAALTLATTETT